MDKRAIINHLDPRAGLWLLLMANIGMFCQKNTEQGSMLSGIFLLLLLVYGQYREGMQGDGFTGYVSIAAAVCISMVPCMDKYGISGYD